MKQILLLLAVPIFSAGMVTGQEKELVILHTNDTHGRIFPVEVKDNNATSQMADEGAEKFIEPDRRGEIGGMAALATAIKELRRKHGNDNVLLVDGGDSFSDGMLSKLTKGEANIRLMNLLGYEFMALGNHDFDFEKDRTKELAGIARFPIRGANVTEKLTDEPFPGPPYTVIEKAGIKVGLLALGYRNTHLTTQSKNIDGLTFKESRHVLAQYLQVLKEKADLIVVVSHEGLEYDKILAEDFNDIDLIIGAHSHSITNEAEKINNTYIVQAFSHGMALGITRLKIEAKKLKDAQTEIRWLWTNEVLPDKEITREIDNLASPYLDTLYAIIGNAKSAIPRNYKSGSPFDLLIGQFMIEETRSDAALLPGVGYGISLNSGPVRLIDLYALLPHDSNMVTLELQGSQLLKTIEKSAENQNPKNISESVGGIIQTAGMEWEADLSKPIGQRVSNVKINGNEINYTTWYKIVTHNAMLNGLHGYDELSKGRSVEQTNIEITQLVKQYIQKKKEITAPQFNIAVKN